MKNPNLAQDENPNMNNIIVMQEYLKMNPIFNPRWNATCAENLYKK